MSKVRHLNMLHRLRTCLSLHNILYILIGMEVDCNTSILQGVGIKLLGGLGVWSLLSIGYECLHHNLYCMRYNLTKDPPVYNIIFER